MREKKGSRVPDSSVQNCQTIHNRIWYISLTAPTGMKYKRQLVLVITLATTVDHSKEYKLNPYNLINIPPN